MNRGFAALLSATVAISAFGQIKGSGSMTYNQVGSSYQYNMTINDIGTTAIGTVWYSWIPGYDFMDALPTNLSAPTGWSVGYFGGEPGDGYSVQFVANSGGIAAGNSLSGFKFTSTDTPAILSGNSSFLQGFAIGTTYVYAGAPELGNAGVFTVEPVPEPITMLVLAPALILFRRRRS